jgi:probable phosphoglycerate mutase
LPRTRQTAEAVAEALKLPILWEDDLHELRPGEADGMTYEAARAVYPGFQTFLSDLYTPLSPGGESWASFQLRISQILATIVARHPGKRIAIVAHGGVIECSFMHLMGLGPQTRSRNAFHVRNTAITHWRGVTIQERHEWQLISHNDHIHLRAEHL